MISAAGADSDAVADSDPVTTKLADADSEATAPVVMGAAGSDSVAEAIADSLGPATSVVVWETTSEVMMDETSPDERVRIDVTAARGEEVISEEVALSVAVAVSVPWVGESVA